MARKLTRTRHDQAALAASLTLLALLLAPVGTQFKWPSGIGIGWYAITGLTCAALIADLVWLVRARRLGMLPAILAVSIALLTLGKLAQTYGTDWSHRQGAHRGAVSRSIYANHIATTNPES